MHPGLPLPSPRSQPPPLHLLLTPPPDSRVQGLRQVRPLQPPAKPAASASLGSLLEMQILGPHLPNQEHWGWDPATSVVTSPLGTLVLSCGTGWLPGPAASTLGTRLRDVSAEEVLGAGAVSRRTSKQCTPCPLTPRAPGPEFPLFCSICDPVTAVPPFRLRPGTICIFLSKSGDVGDSGRALAAPSGHWGGTRDQACGSQAWLCDVISSGAEGSSLCRKGQAWAQESVFSTSRAGGSDAGGLRSVCLGEALGVGLGRTDPCGGQEGPPGLRDGTHTLSERRPLFRD